MTLTEFIRKMSIALIYFDDQNRKMANYGALPYPLTQEQWIEMFLAFVRDQRMPL
jgi:hypothetical protein